MIKPAANIFRIASKFKERLHQFGIIRYRIDHLDRHAIHFSRAQATKVNVRRIDNLIFRNGFRTVENGIRHFFRCRTTIADVILDAEIPVRAARIMAGRQNNTAEGFVFSDDATDSRGRQDTILSDHDFSDAVGCRHFQDDLYGRAVEIPAVSTQHKRLALDVTDRIENGLDKILEVMRLLKHRNRFAQTGCARILVVKRGRAYCLDGHISAPVFDLNDSQSDTSAQSLHSQQTVLSS